jgi:hypothetical protein
MQTGTLSNYIDYFRTWADSDADVRFFLFGGIEKGMEVARSHDDFDYPFAWLEQPTILTEDNGMGNINEVFLSGLTILCAAPQDNRQGEINAYDLALRILYRIQRKMLTDNRQGDIVCDLSRMKKETISQLWLDSHYGWRLEFVCSFNLNLFIR